MSENGGDDAGLWESLAIERTTLSWRRTALSLAAAGGLLLRASEPLPTLPSRIVAGPILLVAMFAWLAGGRRYHAGVAAMRSGSGAAAPTILRAFGYSVGLLALVVVALALLPSVR